MSPETRSPSLISSLFSRLSLKPYGDELLSGSAAFWIFSARLVILTMAAAEAMAWGYMGSLMSPAHPWIAASIAAGFIFILIWIIDSSFMTLDLAGSYYDRSLTERGSRGSSEHLKLGAGVAARIGIVTASLLITAPFLAQAIFSEDVRSEMARRNAATIAEGRAGVEQPFITRLGELRSQQAALEEQRVQEAAGVGPSGRYGRGPALETIELQLADKREEITALERSRAAALMGFDALSPEQLEERYGLELLTPGIQTNTALLDDMMADPRFSRAELAVRAFLAILFVGLLILKLFQPRSVEIYYSERIHSLYDEYRKGIFDDYFPRAERALEGGNVDPIRFEDWCLETYSSIRREEESRRRTAAEQRMHDSLVERLGEIEHLSRNELVEATRKLDATLDELRELESHLHEIRTGTAGESDELRRVEETCASLRNQIDQSEMDGPMFERAMAASQRLEERRRSLTTSLRASDGRIEDLSRQIQLLRTKADRLEREIDRRRAVVDDYENRILEERRSYSERITRARGTDASRATDSISSLSAREAVG